ncbi:MAG TPA: T9SS type A sorting domain-containing protein, partial [Flavisolibacter sp.]|nr:T9SS type A sorting domain-containing protein [Flavisolibacter sp.]
AVITADQPYTHFVIGNFKNNAATDTVRVADTSALLSGGTFAGCNIDRHIAYYFVDDVMVSQIGAGAGCGVLPLQLLEFTGRKRNATVELIWRTENEQNTSHFEVERSRNGIGFTSVGKKQAANSSGEHRYELTDVQPLDGINYYRLKQVDRDGRFVYSPIVRVKFEREREKLKIYPQPAQSTINVVFSGSSQLMVQVYDANGRNVMTEHKQNRGVLTLNVASLAKGAYWIVVTDGTLQQRGQFIKQ